MCETQDGILRILEAFNEIRAAFAKIGAASAILREEHARWPAGERFPLDLFIAIHLPAELRALSRLRDDLAGSQMQPPS